MPGVLHEVYDKDKDADHKKKRSMIMEVTTTPTPKSLVAETISSHTHAHKRFKVQSGWPELAPDQNGCMQPQGLPSSCADFQFTTCFAGKAEGDDAFKNCNVSSEEHELLRRKFQKVLGPPTQPTYYVALGGMGAGKSTALSTLHDMKILDHPIGEQEISLSWDDMLEDMPAFLKSKQQPKMRIKFYKPCGRFISALHKEVEEYAQKNMFNTFQEAYALNRGSDCRDWMGKVLKLGYNIFAVFVNNTYERGLCNAMMRQDISKRYQKVSDVKDAYEKAGDGSVSKQCLTQLVIPAGQRITWIECSNTDNQMSCKEPEIFGRLASTAEDKVADENNNDGTSESFSSSISQFISRGVWLFLYLLTETSDRSEFRHA
eukprot:gnl/MRDRNA2_/MRDRNA2_171157_c0_seq1.p1 gnl/MRDRNA2_/MRDRNA2_171157_c0~~gnl/MRDRNA2_/MRDRNA2_171157_c0_seq1.p1  ORF type:complete len:382 (-),score=67.33 gnl/MRDRNA2_/MRDRNA2_171157_c0_seq1:5-1126(-)